MVVSGLTLAGDDRRCCRASPAASRGPASPGVLFSVTPWFFIMRLLRRGRPPAATSAEALVEELQASREAHAESAALPSAAGSRATCTTCSRTRCRRSRCSSRPRGCWRATAAPTRAWSTTSSARTGSRPAGLDEARTRDRRAARRGDARARAPRARSPTRSRAAAELTVEGDAARALPPRPAWRVYRTAQEALTNVTRHSAADRVEVRLALRAGRAPGWSSATSATARPCRPAPAAGQRLRADRHARAGRAARRRAGRRPRPTTASAWSCGCRGDRSASCSPTTSAWSARGSATLLGLLDGIELVATAADGEEAVAPGRDATTRTSC